MGAHSKSTGYARYVGRLGALAVALGVGTMPGLAWATPETGDQADTVDSPRSAPTSPDPTGAVTQEPNHDSLSSPSQPAASRSTVTGTTTNSSQVTANVGEGSSPPVSVSGSGSLNTTINGEQTSTEPTEPTEPTPPTEPTEPTQKPVTPSEPTSHVTPTQTKGGDHDPVETAKTVTVPNAPAPANHNDAPATPSAPKVVVTPNTSAVVALKKVEPQSFTTTTRPFEAIIPTPAPEPAPAPSTVNVVANVFSTVLASLLLPSPESPEASALLWGVLAWTRRESERTTTGESETTYAALTTTSEPATPAPAARTASLTAAAVAPPNKPPTATPTITNVDGSTGIVTGQLNAVDPNGDPLTYGIKTPPAKGTVDLTTTGDFAYTPTDPARHTAAATPGADVDSFVINVSDSRGGVTAVRVSSVPVTPKNAAPISGSATVGQPDSSTGVVTGSVSATDTDLDSLTYTGPRSTSKGSVVVNANGTFTYTPTATAQHNASLGGAAASDSFTVTVNDGHGGTLAVPVTVAVNPKNAAPVNGASTVGSPNATTGTVTGRVTVTDPDRDALTYSGPSSTSKGAVVVNANGTFTYTPTAAARHQAAVGGVPVNDSFTVTANDGHGGTLAVAVSVAVSPQNAAPKNGSYVVNQPDPSTGVVTGSVSATDADGDTLRYSGPTSTSKGTVAVNTDGTFAYTPTDVARHKALAGGKAATDSFTVTASDGLGGSLAIAVSVTISPKNVAPANPTVTVGQPNPNTGVVTGTVKAPDPDGDTVRYSGTTTTAKGSVTVSTSGTFTYTPTAAAQHAAAAGGAAATDTFTVTATDPYGAALPVTVTVTVNPKNKLPINGVATVGQPDAGSGVVTGTVTATDPDGDTLKYSGSTTTGKGSVVVDANGSFTYTPTAAAQHAASQGGAAAKDTFAVTADDGHGGTLAIQVLVDVNPKNAAPLAATAPSVGNPNSAGVVTGKLNVTDADGDALSYQVVTGPTRGTLTIDSATGTYTYTAKPEERLNASLTTNTVETDAFTIGVTDGRSAPIVVTVGNVLVAELPANTVTGTPGVGDSPRAVVLSADGTHAYVANTDDDTVTVIDTTNNTTIRTIAVGDRPTDLALNTGGSTLYVANAGGNSVTSINTATGAVITTVGIGHEPTGITVSPDGAFVYTANADNTITIVTVASGHAVSVGIDPSEIVINHAGTRVYALNTTDGDVSIIDPSDGSVVDTIHVGDATFGMAINPDDTHLYITQGGADNQVVIVKLDDKTFDYVHVGLDPRGIAVTPDGNRLYVANFGSDTVSIVDLTDNNAVTDINVGDGPWGVGIDSLGTKATVTNSLSDTVTVILIAGNEPPVLHDTRSADFDSGVVSGSLGATDADGDSLSYSATQGVLGTVTIDGAGNYIYTPTPAARHAAAVTPATDIFTLTVDDGHGSSVTKTVTVDIVPQNAVPTTNPTVSSPSDGVVTGTVNAADADGDSLSFAVTNQGTQGTATVNSAGQFTYTPSVTAQLDAAGTLVPQTDTFTVAVDDGHGGVTTTTVPVPIARAGVVGETTVAGSPSGYSFAVSPNGSRTVLVTFDDATGLPRVTVIDNATGQRVGTVTLGSSRSVGNPVFSADGSRAAVSTSNYDSATNTHTSSISLIDTTTGAQTGVTINVPGENYAGLQFSPDGHTAYISTVESTADGSLKTYVTVVDAVTGAKLGTTEGITGTTIGSVVFTSDGSRAYRTVSYIGVDATETRVVAVDTATGAQIGIPLLFTGAAADGGLIATANGHLLQAVDLRDGSGRTTSGQVYTIDAATGLIVGTPVDLAGSPSSDLQGNSAGTRAVQLIRSASGSVTAFVMDTATGAVVGSAPLPGQGFRSPQFTADGSKIVQISYTSSRGPGGGSSTTYLSVIDAVTGQQLGTSASAGGVGTTVFDALGSRAILLTGSSGGGSSLATVVDTGSGAVLSAVPITGRISGTALTPGGRLIVTSAQGGASSVTSLNMADGVRVGSSFLGAGTPVGGMVIGNDGRTGFQLATIDGQSATLFVVDLTGAPVVLRNIAIDGTASVPAQSISNGDAISVMTAKDGSTKVTVIDTAPFLVS